MTDQPDRRTFLGALGAGAAWLGWTGRSGAAPAARPRSGLATAEAALAGAARAGARPTAAQLAWQDLELGMFIHFAPNTWQDNEGDQRTTPLAALNADIDTDQWAAVAADLGARYIVMVAKHVGGFCLWQTDTNDYSIRNTPWKNGRGDVMADLARSCQARGLRLGVYLSPRDDSLGAGLAGRCRTEAEQTRYNAIARQQLTELLTRYGEMVEIWFDGSSVVPVGDILSAHAPGAMIFQGPHATIRWVGNEDGFAPYPAWNSVARIDAATGIATAIHGDPAGEVWLPNEVDVSIRRPDWFWHTDNEHRLLGLDALIDIYYRSVGRGAQLLLNLPPDRTGRIPAPDAARAAEFGAAIRRRFGRPIAEAGPAEGPETMLDLGGSRRVDHVVIEEGIEGGEAVRRYRLEARSGNGWIRVGTGSAIGHKRIQPVGPLEATAVRLAVEAAAGPVRIRRLAAFDTGVAPPRDWNASTGVWSDDDAGRWQDGV
ncbi:MAG: alpha-L-fucosidase, partial [Gemmatimonadales bacterium]